MQKQVFESCHLFYFEEKYLFQVTSPQRNDPILSLNAFAVTKYRLFIACSLITFQSRSMGFKFGLYGGKECNAILSNSACCLTNLTR